HRLAECLLIDVIGMPWEDVHHEACRWEHVMSEAVERRLLEVLGFPTVSPYGNPIPGLDELTPQGSQGSEAERLVARLSVDRLQPLSEVAAMQVRHVTIRRIAEPVQTNEQAMLCLRRAGAVPGAAVTVVRSPGGISIGSSGEFTELGDDDAVHVLVEVEGIA
ncbi:MAG: iron dependent repressor, metal binding and dimerization domain protein, partial [Actinomycetales bacterium]